MKGKSFYFWECKHPKCENPDKLKTRKSGDKKCRKCGNIMSRK